MRIIGNEVNHIYRGAGKGIRYAMPAKQGMAPITATVLVWLISASAAHNSHPRNDDL
jgi:hypothetical protein